MDTYEKFALKSKIDQNSIFNSEQKREFLSDACVTIGYQMKNCNPIQLGFSPLNLSFNVVDSIILPETFLTEYDLIGSVIYLSNVYYFKRIVSAYQSNDNTSNLFLLIEKKLDKLATEKNNIRALKNVVLSASFTFSARELLSEYHVVKYMNGTFAKKLDSDAYLNLCAKEALQAYYKYHKQ